MIKLAARENSNRRNAERQIAGR